MSEPAVCVADLNAIISRTRFLDPYGFEVTACTSGECVLRVPFAEALERPGGIVSAMTLMGAADVALWLAIMTLRGSEEHWVTSDMKTAFLRSARREDVVCTAKVLKLSQRSAYGTAECTSASTGLLAHHVLTYVKADQ